jgi:predicted SAM-dependent methyltransferase
MKRELRSAIKRHLSFHLRVAMREVVNELQIQRRHKAGVRRARGLALEPPVRLNLGCGENAKPGWINIDLFNKAADLALDIREPLPFPDASVATVYSEHVFEHLAYPSTNDSMGWTLESLEAPSEAMRLLRESFRVLRPGGVCSVGVPDAARAVALYCRREYERWGPAWVDTPMHFLNYVFRQGREHKYAYDEETLGHLMIAAGFVGVERRTFQEGLDSEFRKGDTLYMVGRKPWGDAEARVEMESNEHGG